MPDVCRHEWSDQWSAICDDDCPKCGARHVSPYESEDIDQIEASAGTPNAPVFGAHVLISAYTRAQAITDGVLVDVSAMAREAGFRYPVALTRAVWEDCVAWSEEDNRRQVYQDESGRLWDVLWMARGAVKRSLGRNVEAVSFALYRIPRGGRARRPQLVRITAHCGPGDLGLPVITIMQLGED